MESITNNNKLKILSIDGGGIKGLYSMYRLKYIEDQFCKPHGLLLNNYFDIICGCSVGSIIAIGIGLKIPMTDIIKMFEENMKEIFNKDGCCCNCFLDLIYKLKQISGKKYDKQVFENIVNQYVQNKTMEDIENILCIPSYNISTSQNVVFKNKGIEDESKYFYYKNINLSDIIMASCSAPTYFEPHNIDNEFYIDGGLWANNPTMVGIMEALKHINNNMLYNSYKVLSVGNIDNNIYNNIKNPSKQYKFTHIEKLIDALINANTDSSNYYSIHICDNTKGKITRLINKTYYKNKNIKKINLDDTSDDTINKLKELAENDNIMDSYLLHDIIEFFENKRTLQI